MTSPEKQELTYLRNCGAVTDGMLAEVLKGRTIDGLSDKEMKSVLSACKKIIKEQLREMDDTSKNQSLRCLEGVRESIKQYEKEYKDFLNHIETYEDMKENNIKKGSKRR